MVVPVSFRHHLLFTQQEGALSIERYLVLLNKKRKELSIDGEGTGQISLAEPGRSAWGSSTSYEVQRRHGPVEGKRAESSRAADDFSEHIRVDMSSYSNYCWPA